MLPDAYALFGMLIHHCLIRTALQQTCDATLPVLS